MGGGSFQKNKWWFIFLSLSWLLWMSPCILLVTLLEMQEENEKIFSRPLPTPPHLHPINVKEQCKGIAFIKLRS